MTGQATAKIWQFIEFFLQNGSRPSSEDLSDTNWDHPQGVLGHLLVLCKI